MTRVIPIECLIKVMEVVEEAGSITNRECRAILDVNYDESGKILKALCMLGLLRCLGSGSLTKYVKGDRPGLDQVLDSTRGGYHRKDPGSL